MKKDYIEIAFVLDRSGSMESLKQFAIKGFNDFIKQQQEVLKEKSVSFSLVLFDHQYIKYMDRVNLNDIKEIDTTVYVPRGMTALLDAIGSTIVQLGSQIDKMVEDDKPEKVIVAIMTDGQQNSSKEYKQQTIKSIIQTQKNIYNWDILFLSSDLDSINTAISQYGIHSASALCYKATKDGYDNNVTGSAFYGMSRQIYSSIYGSEDDSKS